MSELLGALFHWSPSERHKAIIQNGLLLGQDSTTMSGPVDGDGYICLSPTPSMAWGLSGAVDTYSSEIDEWDLWQVRLTENDQVHVRPMWGNKIEEIKVRNSIPPDRLWFVGKRER